MKLIFLTLIFYVSIISLSQAYIGPGMAAGAIAVVLGIIGAILIALFTVLYYPIKKIIQKTKKNNTSNQNIKKN